MPKTRLNHRSQARNHDVAPPSAKPAALPRIVRLIPQPPRLDLASAAMNLFTFLDFGPLISEARQLAEIRRREEEERRQREEAARARFAAD